MKKLLSKIAIISVTLSTMLTAMPVRAEGVTVDLENKESSTSPLINGVTWERSAGAVYVTGTTITITVQPVMTDVTSSGMLLDIDGDTVIDTQYTTSSCIVAQDYCSITYTLIDQTDYDGSGDDVIFGVTSTQLTFDATARNYSIAIFTSSPVDFGAALFYANGGNQVEVTASVPVTLSFSIKDSADTGDTNVCALGTLNSESVSTCSYRLRIATNAANGFGVKMGADEALNSSGNATMTDIGDNVAFSAGTEAYGIQVFTGASTGGRSGVGDYDQPVVEDSAGPYTFDTDSSPIPILRAGVDFMSYSAPFKTETPASLTTTSLVTHAAAISVSTPAGLYSHTIFYWVTATF
ncbi:MAG: hypothetical protein ABIB04_00275 [Patescibacteria group bacterium]